jgi:hypothetical protein
MLNIRTTETFDVWFDDLKDRIAKRRIQARIDRLAMGNPGDTNSAGAPVTELRIDHAPRLPRVLRAARLDIGNPAVWRRQVNANGGHQSCAQNVVEPRYGMSDGKN